jgi:signal transduction histidine kinase
MSWVTVIYAMIASACLTLAVIYLLVWWRNRHAWAHLLFSITAASTTVLAFCELWVMRADTPARLLAVVAWAHVPLFVCLVSVTWFVRLHLGAGRLWLAWTITVLRAFSMIVNVVLGQDLTFRNITSLQHVQLLGESVTVLGPTPNLATPITQLGSLLVLIFIADATITAWRRGDRRKALMVGGTADLFLFGALGTAMAVIWAKVPMPVLVSPFYLGLVAVMGYELSRDVLRASQLVHDLQRSNQQISDLFGRLIAVQETERTRIARDLHDDIGQRVAVLAIMISRFKSRLRGQPDEAEALLALASMQETAVALAEEIRQVSHHLHPSPLQHSGLVLALAQVCAEFEKRHAITVTFSAGDDLGPIGDDPSLCLYRVTQEALRNVAKHARARQVGVTLTRTAAGLQLSVVDDGTGFDVTATRAQGTGLGLVSIDERVRQLRGRVRIDTQGRGGTHLHVQIPMPDARSPAPPAGNASPPAVAAPM